MLHGELLSAGADPVLRRDQPMHVRLVDGCGTFAAATTLHTAPLLSLMTS